MGIMDFFRKKNIKETTEENEEKNSDGVVLEKEFLADISLCELHNVDWSEFGAKLKQNRILPNSYIKKPSKVEVLLDKKNRPKVMLEFKSSTSKSVREFMLLQDDIFQYVNGAIENENEKRYKLIEVWKNYQNEIRYRNKSVTNREGLKHSLRGERLMLEAQKMKGMRDIYDREQEFLKQYNNVVFDGFHYDPIFQGEGYNKHYSGELPKFIPLIKTEDGRFIDGEPVIPFTPRTLEFCILHMTNGQKIEDGEFVEGFEKKCRDLQEYSCYKSDDWDTVIQFAKDIVHKHYQVNVLENEM